MDAPRPLALKYGGYFYAMNMMPGYFSGVVAAGVFAQVGIIQAALALAGTMIAYWVALRVIYGGKVVMLTSAGYFDRRILSDAVPMSSLKSIGLAEDPIGTTPWDKVIRFEAKPDAPLPLTKRRKKERWESLPAFSDTSRLKGLVVWNLDRDVSAAAHDDTIAAAVDYYSRKLAGAV